MPDETKGILYALGAAITASFVAVFIKFLSDVPLVSFLFFRSAFSFLCLIPSLLINKVDLHVKPVPKHLFKAIMG